MKSILVALGLLGSWSVFAVECPTPATPGSLELTLELVQKSADCNKAAKIAKACAWGSTADESIAGAAREICEKNFLTKFSPEEKKGYELTQKRCPQAFDSNRAETGSIGISRSALCSLGLAKKYSKFFDDLAQDPNNGSGTEE